MSSRWDQLINHAANQAPNLGSRFDSGNDSTDSAMCEEQQQQGRDVGGDEEKDEDGVDRKQALSGAAHLKAKRPRWAPNFVQLDGASR